MIVPTLGEKKLMMANRQESPSETVREKSTSDILLQVIQQKIDKDAIRQQLRLDAQKLLEELEGKNYFSGIGEAKQTKSSPDVRKDEEEPSCSTDGQETKKTDVVLMVKKLKKRKIQLMKTYIKMMLMILMIIMMYRLRLMVRMMMMMKMIIAEQLQDLKILDHTTGESAIN